LKREDLINLTGDSDLSEKIVEVSKLINKYCYFFNSVDLGVKYTPQDLSFSEMMLYSWIKDGLSNGRKN
jgi:hypothetical protein